MKGIFFCIALGVSIVIQGSNYNALGKNSFDEYIDKVFQSLSIRAIKCFLPDTYCSVGRNLKEDPKSRFAWIKTYDDRDDLLLELSTTEEAINYAEKHYSPRSKEALHVKKEMIEDRLDELGAHIKPAAKK